MMYITLPPTTIDNGIDLVEYNSIRTSLNKRGYGITYFGKDGVNFYRISSIKPDKGDANKTIIPITNFYSFSKKEFIIFLDVIERLEETEEKLSRYIRFAKTY